MREQAFEIFLKQEPSITSDNAVVYRFAKARKVEELLGASLDDVVSDDRRMYDALLELAQHESSKHNRLQNSLRKYYKFRNNQEFPSMRTYRASLCTN